MNSVLGNDDGKARQPYHFFVEGGIVFFFCFGWFLYVWYGFVLSFVWV